MRLKLSEIDKNHRKIKKIEAKTACGQSNTHCLPFKEYY